MDLNHDLAKKLPDKNEPSGCHHQQAKAALL